MAADSQYQLSVIQPSQPAPLTKAARQAVPQFLQKLYEMVSNSSTNHLIKWSDAGDAFIVLDHERFARDVLPRWFKHNNFASFVRQLNMYGFHKIPHLQQGVLKSDAETELMTFEHPSFRRNQPDLLCLITRKKQAPERNGADSVNGEPRDAHANAAGGEAAPPPGAVMDINTIMSGITSLKRHQAAISAELNDLKNSNQMLWQEALAARERHDKHQQTINKILKFLAGVFGNPGSPHQSKSSTTNGSTHPIIPRRRQPLLIENGPAVSSSTDAPMGTESVTSNKPNGHVSGKEGASIQIVDAPTPDVEKLRSPSLMPSVTTPATEVATPFTDSVGQMFDSSVNGNSTLPPHADPQPTFASTQTGAAAGVPFFQPSNLGASTSTQPTDMNMLTSASQQQSANKDAVLQSILNSPGQLQKLFSMMQSQQPMPIPQTAAPDTGPDDPFTNYDRGFGATQRPISPLSLSQDVSHFDQPGPFLRTDDAPNLDPLLENTAQLQKSYKDAASISAHMDTMQASIDSLINDLGLDPSQLTTFDVNHDQDEPVLSSAGVAPMQPHNLVDPSIPVAMPDVLPPQSNTIPDFDIEAFLRELNRQQAEGIPTAVYDSVDPVRSIPFVEPSAASADMQDRVSAYVDEINSNSDTSSPPAHRVTLADEQVFEDLNGGSRSKKGKKRKSDLGATGLERNPSKTKRKR